MIKLEDQQVDPLSLMSSIEKRWQMGQLVSIPENSDPFYSITDFCPESPVHSTDCTLPDETLSDVFVTRSVNTINKKRRKYNMDPQIKIMANQIIPRSTKPTKLQQLQKRIAEVWEKRFTPKRVLNELYVPGVLYATRARFVRSEEDYWMVSQDGLLEQGNRKVSHDPLSDLSQSGCSIDNYSVYLRRESQMSAASSSKSTYSKARSLVGLPEKNKELLTKGHGNSTQDENITALRGGGIVRESESFSKQDKKRKFASKSVKRFQLSPGKTVQTFERRKTRPEDSMYESLDPPVLNKNKLSKAFCDG